MLSPIVLADSQTDKVATLENQIKIYEGQRNYYQAGEIYHPWWNTSYSVYTPHLDKDKLLFVPTIRKYGFYLMIFGCMLVYFMLYREGWRED